MHTVLGAFLAQAQGGSAAGGAAGGLVSSAGAQALTTLLYPGVKAEELTGEQKELIANLITLAGAGAGGLIGGNLTGAGSGANTAKNEVENNALSVDACPKGNPMLMGACGGSGNNIMAGATGAAIGLGIAAGMSSDDSESESQPNAGKDLSDADKVELGGTGSGTPGGWGPEDEENARNSDHQNITVEDLTSTSSKGQQTTGRSKLFERSGGSDAANKEFNALSPSDIKDIPGGRVGKLPDGRTVIVRERSTDGRPTLEIQSGKNRIKFRYDE
nr:VENN motif pre-toxin domain-containing protein [Brenneria tiliae]